MFTWIKQLIAAIAELLDAQSALLQTKLRQFGLLAAMALMGILIASFAIVGLLVGVAMILAPRIGAAEAALVVSGGTLLLILLIGGIAWAATKPEVAGDDSPKETAEQAKAKLHALFEPSGGSSESGADAKPNNDTFPSSATELVEKTVLGIAKHPDVVAGSIFAVVSILGVGRTLRAVRSAAGIVTTGAMAYRTASRLKQQFDHYIAKETHSSAPAHDGSAAEESPNHPNPSGSANNNHSSSHREDTFMKNSAADHEHDVLIKR